MVSKDNVQLLKKQFVNREVPRYSLRKLGIGVVSVLLGTTMYLGANSTVANADVVTTNNDSNPNTSADTTETAKNTEIQANQVALTSNSQIDSDASGTVSRQSAVSPVSVQDSNDISQKVADNSVIEKDSVTAKAESKLSPQSSPVLSNSNNDSLNKTNNDDEQTAGYAEVYPITQYAWASAFTDPNTSRQIPTIYGTKIKFEKDSNGKYKLIDLKALANEDAQKINKLEQLDGSDDHYDAYFVDQYNHEITTLDPNKIAPTQKYPLYLKVVMHSQRSEIFNGGGTVLQPAMDQFKPADNNQSFTQTIQISSHNIGDGYYLPSLGMLTYWSVFAPNEIIDKVFNNDLNSNAGNWKTLYSYRNAIASPEYLKALLTSDLPVLTRNGQQYYLCLRSIDGSSLSDGITSDDWDSLYQLFMDPDKLQRALNNLEIQDGQIVNDQSNILSKFYNAMTPKELTNRLNESYSNYANAGGNTVLVIPELDSNGKVISGKYAGRMILNYGIPSSDNESVDLNIKYASMDPGYKGALPSIYGYLGGGDAECSGVYVLPRTSVADITYIDDTTKQKLSGGEQIQGHYGDKIIFSKSPAQRIADYEEQGYKLVSNNYNSDQLFNPDGTKNEFEVHFVHVAVPQVQTKTATRTIHYILDDGSIMHDDNGKNIPNFVQTVNYIGTSYIDKVTQKLTNAKEITPNNWIVDTTNTATPAVNWKVTPEGKDKFVKVLSPNVKGYSQTPTVVKEEVPTMPAGSRANQDIYVVYKAIPTTYTATRENKMITRTINYLDSQTSREVVNTPAIIQQATLYRYQIKNEKGNVIGYGVLSPDGHTYQLSDLWIMDQNGWQSKTSPDLTKLGYKKTPHFIGGQDALVVKAGQPDLVTPVDIVVNVYYDHDIVPVTPDKPGNGLKNTDLTKNVTETVHYVGAGNQTPADKVAQLHFTGTAYYDAVTKKWTDANGTELNNQTENITWLASNGQRFDTVITPAISGYTSSVQKEYDDGNGNVKGISGIKQDSADIHVTVTYHRVGQPTTPQPTVPQPTTPQPTTPQPTVPQSTTPQLTVPQSTTPQLTVPQSTTPQLTVPQSTTPQLTVPQPTTPQPTVPQPTTPQPTTPQPTVPQPTTPQPTTPQPTVPQPTTPQPTTPQPTVPQPTMLQTTLLQSSVQPMRNVVNNYKDTQSQGSPAQNDSTLPQTGNMEKLSVAVLGLMGLSIATGLGLGATRKYHE